MYARASRFEGPVDKYDEGVVSLKERGIPMAEKIPGFMGGYWLGNKATGNGRAVIFYSSAQTLKDSTAIAADVRKQTGESVGLTFSDIQELEVILDTGQKVHRDAGACRVVDFQADPGRIDDFVQRARENIIPTLQKVEGFKGGVWLVDRATGKGLGVTLFGTRAQLTASTEVAKGLIQSTSQALGMSPLAVEEWDIVAKAETPVGAGAH